MGRCASHGRPTASHGSGGEWALGVKLCTVLVKSMGWMSRTDFPNQNRIRERTGNLSTSKDVVVYLSTSEDVVVYLSTSKDVVVHLSTSKDFVVYLSTSKDFVVYLSASKDFVVQYCTYST
jgi:hypothetical protein